MKKAMISEVKAKLSAYLSEVRNGGIVVICDRATPIAQLAPLDKKLDDLKIQEASRPANEIFRVPGVRLRKRMNVDRILDETRGGR
jgi:antitoxin (DNA-binding transcriptional repressor) of toxin-antitoxin stability system